MSRSEELRICTVCGKEFVPTSSVQKMCSEACRAEQGRRQARRYNREHGKLKVCPGCGEKFHSTSTGRKYCCDACKREALLRRATQERQGARPVFRDRRPPDPPPRSKDKADWTLADICAAAREAGLTYGQYVARYGL